MPLASNHMAKISLTQIVVYGVTWAPGHCWWVCKLAQLPWKTVWNYLEKFEDGHIL